MGHPENSEDLEVRDWYSVNKLQKRLGYLIAGAVFVYIIFREDLAAFLGLKVDVLNYVGFATMIAATVVLSHFLRDKEEIIELKVPTRVRLAGLAVFVLLGFIWFGRDFLSEYSGMTARQITAFVAVVSTIVVAVMSHRYPFLVKKKSAATGKPPSDT